MTAVPQNQSPSPTRSRRWAWPLAVVLVTLLALGLRLYYVNTARVINPIRADAAQYYAYAWNLAHHGVFSGSPQDAAKVIPDSYRDPGYPLLLAFWMKIFNTRAFWYAAALLTQTVLSALTIPLAMQLGRRWLSWPWVVAAGVLMAVWPHNIAIASDLLSETLFGFLCALAMWSCIRACDRRSMGGAIMAGIAFGAAALTNAVMIPFGIVLGLYFAWRHMAPRRVWLALCLAAAVLPGAWVVRNHQLTPNPSGQTSIDRALQNLVQGSWPAYHAAYAALARRDMRGLPIFNAIDAEYRLLRRSPATGTRVILQRLDQHPLRYLTWYTLEKPWDLWSWDIRVGWNDIYVYATVDSPFDIQPAMRALEAVCHTINPLLAALMLACLVITLSRFRDRRNNPGIHAPALDATLLLLVYITVVYSVLQTDPRYSIAFRSFEMLLAMTSFSALVAWVNRVRTRQAALPTAAP